MDRAPICAGELTSKKGLKKGKESMLSRVLEKTTKDFIIAINQAAKAQAEQIAEIRSQTIYTEEHKNEQESKARAATAAAMQMVRDTARDSIMSAFANARATVENSVSEGAHDTTFEEIKNVAEATDGNFTEFEIGVLLEKCAGHYWAMKLLSRLTRDNTNAAAILKERFKMPDPNFYLDLFDDEEGYLLSFIQIYKDDQATAIDIARSDVNGETLISGDHFQRLHERLEINPDYLTDDDFSAPALRSFERRTLRSSGIVLDVNDTESRKRVKAAARQGGAVKNCLMRTIWRATIEEETKIMWQEAQDDAQLKYGSAGKTAFNAVGSRY